jgi:hypothetical protein
LIRIKQSLTSILQQASGIQTNIQSVCSDSYKNKETDMQGGEGENQSAIARLREQIEAEAATLFQGMHGLRTAASHAIIQHRYQCLGKMQEELAQYVGEDASLSVTIAAINAAEAGDRPASIQVV